MYLALTDLYLARWSEAIHEDWIRNAIQDYPDFTLAKAVRIRALMDANVRDCLVTGYEMLIPALTLPDPDDRHVLAAAIRVGAVVIVTANLKDFPPTVLREYGIEARHPDGFISELLTVSPDTVCGAVRRQRESLKNPPMTVVEFLSVLERQNLPQTVKALLRHADLL
jgi:hypothetical protein